MQADGYSLDDKRTPLNGDKHENNNIPDILARWNNRELEKERERTEQSFLVTRKEISDQDYDLNIKRYKEIIYEEIEFDPPLVILDELQMIEAEIQQDMTELRGILK
jgi:type I restriction enzyme M protein